MIRKPLSFHMISSALLVIFLYVYPLQVNNIKIYVLLILGTNGEKGLAADLHLHAQTLALQRVMSLAVFFILFYLLIIFSLNLSTFYNSSQVVKTRKK